ncbi:MAG: cysteine hydrolase family protein [Actinomycetota bacterium]
MNDTVVRLRGLERKADPSHAALIVIDMQNDFCAEGGMMHNEGRNLSQVQEMAGRLTNLIDAARDAGVFVVFVRNTYSTPDNWYLSDAWLEQAERRRAGSYTERPVCAPGSWNFDFYGAVRPLESEPIVTKHRFSAFHNTDLDTILRSRQIRTVVATGVATNVCVETTVRDAFIRDYYVLVVEDATATYSPEEHRASLATIDRYFGEVVTSDQVVKIWSRTSSSTRSRA